MLFPHPYEARISLAPLCAGSTGWRRPRLSVSQLRDHVWGDGTRGLLGTGLEAGRQAGLRRRGMCTGMHQNHSPGDRGQEGGQPPGPTCSTRLIHWKLSSSEASGRCSATSTIRSSCRTVTENTAILGEDEDKNDHPAEDTKEDTDASSPLKWRVQTRSC